MNEKDWTSADFYACLGVEADASAADIKRAYRRIARDNHPDTAHLDPGAATRFAAAARAWEVLGDTDERARYDRTRALLGPNGRPKAGTTTFDDLLRESRSTKAPPRAGAFDSSDLNDLLGQLNDTVRQARSAHTTLNNNVAADARRLDDWLRDEAQRRTKQSAADEAAAHYGDLASYARYLADTTPGTEAGTAPASEATPGRGDDLHLDVNIDLLDALAGHATTVTAPGRKPLKVRIPAGVNDKGVLKLSGRGADGQPGAGAGDLYLHIHVNDHPHFTRHGHQLNTVVPVTFDELALGATIAVPDPLGGTRNLHLAPGTRNQTTIVLPGEGVLRVDGTRGDYTLTLEVAVPTTLTDAHTAALRAYAVADLAAGTSGDTIRRRKYNL